MSSTKRKGRRQGVGEKDRDLGSLFAGGGEGDNRSAVDADLAALLDVEFWAAEAGSATPTARRRSHGPKISEQAPERADGSGVAQVAQVGSEPAGESQIDVPLQVEEGGSDRHPEVEAETGADAESDAGSAEALVPAALADLSEVERAAMLSRLDSILPGSWEQGLHREIEELYQQVVSAGGEAPELAERSLRGLREARRILVETPEAFGAAEYRVSAIRAELRRQQESARQTRHYGPRILGYQACWLVLLLAGLLLGPSLAERIGATVGGGASALTGFLPGWALVLWGGIGGVCGSLYGLWRSGSDSRGFDRRLLVGNLVLPLTGMVGGGVVYLVMTLGQAVAGQTLADGRVLAIVDASARLVAVALGFWQQQIWRLFGGRRVTPGSVPGEMAAESHPS